MDQAVSFTTETWRQDVFLDDITLNMFSSGVVSEIPETVRDQGLKCHKIRGKEVLYYRGDRADMVYQLREGLIRITRLSPEGRIMTVRHILPGDYFGEEVLLENPREENAEVVVDSVVSAFDPQYMDYADLMTITQSLARQMQRLVNYECHLQQGDLYQRVSRYLFALAGTSLAYINEDSHMVVPVTHEFIAQGTAATRESVSEIIMHMRSAKLIETGYRKIVLIDPSGLAAACGEF
jgi:CRP-like cAMP-binding protein